MSNESNETFPFNKESTEDTILYNKILELGAIEKLIYKTNDGTVGVGKSEIDKDYLDGTVKIKEINQKISFVQLLIEKYSNININSLNIGNKEVKDKFKSITTKYPNLESEILSFLKKEEYESPKKVLETLNNLDGLLGVMVLNNDTINDFYVYDILDLYDEKSFTDNKTISIGEKYKKIKEYGFISEFHINRFTGLLTIPIEKLEKLKEITNNKKIENLNNEEKKSYIDFLESDLQTTKSYFKNFDDFSKENFSKENNNIKGIPESLMNSFLNMNKENQNTFKNLLTDFENISNKTPDIKEKFILDNMLKINTNILELQKIVVVFFILNHEINKNNESLIDKISNLLLNVITKKENELLEQDPKLKAEIEKRGGIDKIKVDKEQLTLIVNKYSSQNQSQEPQKIEKPVKNDKINEISPKIKTIADKIEGGEKLVNFLKNENENEKQSINIGLDGKIQVGKDDNLYYTNSLGYKFEFNKDNSGLNKMFDTIDKMDYFLKIGLGYFGNNFKNMVDTIKDIVPSVSAISIDEKEGNFLDNIETEKILNVFKSIGIIGDFDVNNTKPNILKDIEMDEKMKKINENGNVFYDKNTGFNKQNFKEALIKII